MYDLSSRDETPDGHKLYGDGPVGGEAEEGVGAVQDFPRAGVKVDGEGEHDAQRQGSQALSAVRGEHGAGTEAHVGHGHHLGEAGTISALNGCGNPDWHFCRQTTGEELKNGNE